MKGTVEQAWKNRLKVIRAAIRLKYSIDADNELNRVMDEEKKKFYKSVQMGRLPEALDMKKVTGA